MKERGALWQESQPGSHAITPHVDLPSLKWWKMPAAFEDHQLICLLPCISGWPGCSWLSHQIKWPFCSYSLSLSSVKQCRNNDQPVNQPTSEPANKTTSQPTNKPTYPTYHLLCMEMMVFWLLMLTSLRVWLPLRKPSCFFHTCCQTTIWNSTSIATKSQGGRWCNQGHWQSWIWKLHILVSKWM